MDRHAQASPDKTAIVFVPELESDDHVKISYTELLRQVNEFAAVLRDSLGHAKPAASSPSSKPSATPSPSPQPPDQAIPAGPATTSPARVRYRLPS